MNTKRILGVIGAIIVIIAIFDIAVGAVSKKLILNVPDVGVNQTNAVQAMFKRDADVLILGPSSANHHYNCKIIEDSLHLSAYNAGRDGQNIVYAAMVLTANVERQAPKVVILDMSSVMLDGDWNSHLSDMYCYYGISHKVDSIIKDVSSWQDKLKLHLNLYRYNNTLPWIVNGYLAKTQADLNGYRPMPVQNGEMKYSVSNDHFVADGMDMRYLKLIVDICRKNQIDLKICSSPSLKVSKGNFHVGMKRFCEQHHLTYWNWNGDTAYIHHPELFYDISHLNTVGADKFTKELVRRIKTQ